MLISIVTPVYKAENIVDELVNRLEIELKKITTDYEIILVEDGGPDQSWERIIQCGSKNNKVKGIKLSRNFGQHHAITAGLDHCTGEWVVVMDCDLQDDPREIINLHQEAIRGYDIVFARRIQRKDSIFKNLSSVFFFKVFSYLSGIKHDGSIANFGIYNKKVINTIRTMREPMRAFSPMVRWVGFRQGAIDVTHFGRFEGKSSYSWNKLINLGIDIAVAYSDKPLKLAIKGGLAISLISILFAIYNIIAFYTGRIQQAGYASLIVSIWLLSGLIIFTLGIIGLYIGKTFDGTKGRPLYIEDQKINI